MTLGSSRTRTPLLRRKVKTYKHAPGRPKKPFFEDEERYEVAFVEMGLRTKINGRLPSRRQAAQRAALLRDYDLQQRTTSGKPPAAQ